MGSSSSSNKVAPASGVNGILFRYKPPVKQSLKNDTKYSDETKKIINEIKSVIVNMKNLNKNQLNHLENLDKKNLLELCKLYDKMIGSNFDQFNEETSVRFTTTPKTRGYSEKILSQHSF